MAARTTTRRSAAGSRRGAPVDPVMVSRARDLLQRAHLLLDNADGVEDTAERFRQLYLVALRAAGAAIAIGEPPTATRRKTSNAWTRIGVVVPELAAPAARFASLSSVRMKIESGLIRTLDPDSVAGMRRLVVDFLRHVETMVIAYEQGKFGTEEVQIGQTA
ncbi:SAV_6107 family HEPN domain-containing protein [Gordonia aurantiaca]|uniref:SAV_6107 family HEPN domain-containing protein n=1 Tax=Gordonia sp. B21 TaxID=3151852 RepID=UPI0032675BBE